MNKIQLLLLFLGIQIIGWAQAPEAFLHPGVLTGQSELDELKTVVQNRTNDPRVAGYTRLAGESLGSLNYNPTPYADVYVIASGSCPEEKAFRQDAHALYIQALKWVVTGNDQYRDKAIEIADSWAATFKQIIPEANKPNQPTLEASWALPIWVAGAEILKYYDDGASGWSSDQFDSFVRAVLVYVNGNIYQTANWLISKDLSLMSAGVFLNDKDLYNKGYNHVTGQIDDITVNGEIPELTRDFVHSQYVLIGLTQCAEIAWQQGDGGLFIRSDARLRTGAEAYVQSVLGIIQPNYISDSDWARHSAPYEILLNRYTELGMKVPNVANYVISFNRSEDGSEDHFVGWLSTTHAISASVDDLTNDVPGNLAYQQSITATSEPQPENPATSAVDNNLYTRWSAFGFPQSLEVDFGSVKQFDKTEIICYSDRAYQFVIETKKSESDTYTQVVDRSANTTQGTLSSPITDEFDPVEGRFVRITVKSAYNYTGTWVSIIEFRIFNSQNTSTRMNEYNNNRIVFPNPTSDIINIDGNAVIQSVDLFNTSGKLVLRRSNINSSTDNFDVSSFSPGTYLYKITDKNGDSETGQIVVN